MRSLNFIAAGCLVFLFLLGGAARELAHLSEENRREIGRGPAPGYQREDALSMDQSPLLRPSSSIRRRSVLVRRAPNDFYSEERERMIKSFAESLERRLGLSKVIAECVAERLFNNARHGIREDFGPVKILRDCRILHGEATEADHDPYWDYYLDSSSRKRDSTSMPKDVDLRSLPPYRSPPTAGSDDQRLSFQAPAWLPGNKDSSTAAGSGSRQGGRKVEHEGLWAKELGSVFASMRGQVQRYFGPGRTRPGMRSDPLVRPAQGLVPVRGRP